MAEPLREALEPGRDHGQSRDRETEGVHALQDYLRRLFENDKLTVAGRLKKTDSVELNNGPDFLGVISADDQDGSTFTLQIAILDVDLDDEE